MSVAKRQTQCPRLVTSYRDICFQLSGEYGACFANEFNIAWTRNRIGNGFYQTLGLVYDVVTMFGQNTICGGAEHAKRVADE